MVCLGEGLVRSQVASPPGESDLGRPGASRRFSPSVPQVRTRDMSYFRDVPQAHASLARIRPVQPTHSGTFCCTISHDQLPVARLFFFLKGARGAARGAGQRGAGARGELTGASPQ